MATGIAEAFERLQERVGARSRIEIGAVSARDYQRFAYAVGHLDERYLVAPGERTRAGEAAEAPPIYLSAVLEWSAGPAEARLRADGSQPDSTGGLPLEGLRLMGAGQDLEFHAPVTDGLELAVEIGVESVEYKEGRSGALIVLVIRREFVDDSGAPVLTCLETVIAR